MLRPERGSDLDVAAGGHASSECVRSAVTEAGCASSATRRPASGARKAGSAIRRSMPNFMVHGRRKFERKAIGVMEVRLAGWMRQGPIGHAAALVFDQRRQAETPRGFARQIRQAIQLQRGLQCV
jgi:hypothetical protein